jgi:tryptophan synthase beta chain
VLHGALSSVIADDDGQILEAHSVSAGLDYPGVGPEHAHLRDSGRARYEAVTDQAALAAFAELSRLEGIVPALEPSHAIAWLLAEGGAPGGVDLLTLSGRGDKDLDEVLAKLGGEPAGG